jgi:hypothetical protein
LGVAGDGEWVCLIQWKLITKLKLRDKKMKKSFYLLVLLIITMLHNTAFGENGLSIQQITKRVVQVTNKYAKSISCEQDSYTDPKMIAALSPYKGDIYDGAEYAVLWYGDIGCAGGSGTTTVNLAIVKVTTGESFIVDATQSSPAINFDYPSKLAEVAGNNRDSLIINGCDWGKNDGNNFPSIPISVIMMRDNKGNWNTVSKTPAKHRLCQYN